LCEDCLSFAVVAAEFWSLQKKCGSQRTNRVRQTLGEGDKGVAFMAYVEPQSSTASVCARAEPSNRALEVSP